MSVARRFISPAVWLKGILFSPILQRELRASGRRKSTYIIRGGYAALFALGALLAISTIMSAMEFDSATMRSQGLSMLAESMVMFVVWFQFIAIVLLAPSMTSPSVCEEKQRGTLGALMTTPLTAGQIVVGKMTGRMYQVLLLALISAPLLLAIRVFGGVPTEWVLAFTSVTLSAALLAGSLGMLYAMWHERSGPASIFALLTLGLMFVTPPLVMFAIQQTGFDKIESTIGVSQEEFMKLVPYGVAACPPVALVMVVTDRVTTLNIPFIAGTPFDRIWLLSTLYMLSVAAFVLWVASRSMRKLLLESSGAIQSAGESASKESGAPKGRRGIDRLKTWPVYWREARTPWLPTRFQRAVLTVVLVSLLGYAYFKIDLADPPMHQLVGFSGLGVLLLCSTVMTTSSINGERVADTWDALMTSPVTGKQVILGKYLAVVRRLAPIAVLTSLHFVVMVVLGHVSWGAALMVVSLITTTPLFYLATGIMFSLLLKKGVSSSVSNIVLLLMILLIVPIIIAIIFEALMPRDDLSRFAEKVVVGSNPLMMLGTVINDDIDGRWTRGDRQFSLGSDGVSMSTMIAVTLAQGAAHIALAAGVLAFSIGRFRSASGRSS